MAKFSVNTHHAYLNNEIVLRSDEVAKVVDGQTGELYVVLGEKSIYLTAGKHILSSEDHDEEIIIEDAIKLGGGRIKNAFVFDNNPWIFVTTKDRMYIYNYESKEKTIEYNVTPDEIKCVDKNIASNYFVFKTNSDYSIYNVESGKIIFTYYGHVYSNGHLVVYKNNDITYVYDYLERKSIKIIENQYAIGDKYLYFIDEKALYKLNLDSNNVEKIRYPREIYSNMFILTSDYFIILLQSEEFIKYRQYYLADGKNHISQDIILPCFIRKWEGIECEYFKKLEKQITALYSENKKLFNSYHVNMPLLNCIDVSSYKESDDREVFLSGCLCLNSRQSKNRKIFNIPFTIMSNHENRNVDFNYATFSDDNVISDNIEEEKKEIDLELNSKEYLISKSDSGNLIITREEGKLYLRNCISKTKEEILSSFFDTTFYTNAYFTSDGKNVVLQLNDTETKLLGIEDMKMGSYEIEGFTVARNNRYNNNKGYNGYMPEIRLRDGRIPVWRDPITLKTIPEDEIFGYVFMSPDGRFSANISVKTVYFNRLAKKETTIEERAELRNKYNWDSETSKEEKENIIKARKELAVNSSRHDLFGKIIEKWNDDEDIIKREIEAYMERKDNFVDLFIDELGYVCIRENKPNGKEREILIGRSVYFLNYVSFSYDSKYLSFGAKMRRDTFRNSEDGVFVIYDIENDRVINRMDNYNGMALYAVWMTMFSKKGDVAFYDSKADAYLLYTCSEYNEIKKIDGKSLLCFSPSGKYIAFSDQNYIDYSHHPEENWGHQPSGNIFIYATDDIASCMEQYNDFGEGINGVARRAGNVASAAFSQDEKRLLAVGNDGVVVIRNLKKTRNEI